MNLAEILAELNAANNEWENRDIEYAEAEAAFRCGIREGPRLQPGSGIAPSPRTVSPVWRMLIRGSLDPATAVATAAEKALAGLRSSDPGDQRREAVVEFRAAAESFNQQVDQITEITLQGFGR